MATAAADIRIKAIKGQISRLQRSLDTSAAALKDSTKYLIPEDLEERETLITSVEVHQETVNKQYGDLRTYIDEFEQQAAEVGATLSMPTSMI